MVTTIDLALMAGRAYESTRALINKIPTPESWLLVRPDKDDATGFEAVTFVKEGYTFRNSPEIVISYAGTYFDSGADKLADINRGCAEFCVDGESTAGVSPHVRKHNDNQEARSTRRTAGQSAGRLQEA